MIRGKDGTWLFSDAFRSEALRFKRDGYYCSHPKGTLDYNDYWDEQLRRCIHGYCVDGEKITGVHYFYLNFCNIGMIDVNEADGAGQVKGNDFPSFWDWDYEYFWWLEIARFGVLNRNSQARELLTKAEARKVDSGKMASDERHALESDVVKNRLKLRLDTKEGWLSGGHHMIVAKSRRKGFSYKNTALTANTYNTVRDSQCVIGVIDKKYAKEDMKMVGTYLDLLNDNTAWGKRREVKNQAEWKKASFMTLNEDGKPVERGYKSEIRVVSFQDNPEAANGLSPYYLLFEEVGIFNNLKSSWGASEPSLKAGKFVVGQAILYGTGGVTSDDNGEFSDMFYNPMAYNMMPFRNIWDDGHSEDWCGFFFSAAYDLEGFYDRDGNSDEAAALEYLAGERKRLLDTSNTVDAYNEYVVQFPICPKEAFRSTKKSVFNTALLEKQLGYVRAGNLQFKMGTCVKLVYSGDGVEAKPILDGSADPIVEYRYKNRDLTGCPIIYEYPVDDAPRGLYKIGYDPYAKDKSTGDSLGAIYVYKGIFRGDFSRNIIVAEYVGRPETAEDMDEVALKFAILYNTEVMFESNVEHTRKYFQRRHRLDRLCVQPTKVVSYNIKKSQSSYKFGCHLDNNMKAAGEEYVKEYLRSVIDYDENGDPVTPVNYIYSIGLLEELIKYNREGNFDRVCALFQIMFQLQDEEIEQEYGVEEARSRVDELLELSFFKR